MVNFRPTMLVGVLCILLLLQLAEGAYMNTLHTVMVKLFWPQYFGKTCPQVCTMNKLHCNAQVGIFGVGRATGTGQAIGTFYNYGCNSERGPWKTDELTRGETYIFRRHYRGWLRCYCCRKSGPTSTKRTTTTT